MNSNPIFKNARMVLRDEVRHGSLQVIDGRIAAINGGATAAAETHDLEGDWLLPGLVEVHTDNFERHLMPRPKTAWAPLPALLAHDAEIAAAGITTVLDALGVGEMDQDSLRGSSWTPVVQALDFAAAQDLLRADHHLHVRCELPAPNTIDLFQAFHGHPRLSLISLMDHTPGQRQWENLEQAKIYYVGKKGWSLEKFELQVARATESQRQFVEPHRQHFEAYGKTHGVSLASHDDTTVAHVDQAHAAGACMSEFPTTVVAAERAKQLGLLTVMGAPNVMRGGSHSGNVSAIDLSRRGLLDALSSDYIPASLLGAATRLVDEEIYSWPEAIARVSRNPARISGFHDRSELAVGLRADLVQMRLVRQSTGGHLPIVRAVWRAGKRVL